MQTVPTTAPTSTPLLIARARTAAACVAVALIAALVPALALAQAFPSRVVKIVVPFPEGDRADLVGRAVAASLARALAVPVQVENRPGDDGIIGSDAVAKSAPDGYTLGIATSNTHPVAAVLRRSLPYDAMKSFAPITLVAVAPYVLVADPALPAANLKELSAYTWAHPDKVKFANVGTLTLGYLLSHDLRARIELRTTDVTYKDASQIYPALNAGQVSLFLENPGASSTWLVNGGKLRAYGATIRAPSMPGVPLFTNLGDIRLLNFNWSFWYGLVAPAGTPKAVVERIHAEMAKYLHSPLGREDFQKLGLVVSGEGPEMFGPYYIQAQILQFATIASRLGRGPQ